MTEQPEDRIKGLADEMRAWVSDGYGGPRSQSLIERGASALTELSASNQAPQRERDEARFLLALMAACAATGGINADTGESITWRQEASDWHWAFLDAKRRAIAAESSLSAALERVGELEKGVREIANFRPRPEDCDPTVPDDPYIQMAKGCKAIARALLTPKGPESGEAS